MINFASIFENIFRNLPCSLDKIVARKVSNYSTVCDIGCGENNYYIGKIKMNRGGWKVGCDIFQPSVFLAKEKGIYNFLVVADLKQLPFKSKIFDVVLAVHVVEHVDKKEGEVFKELERIARRLLIIITPRGYVPFSFEGTGNNVYQEHRAGYDIEDFRKYNFQVRGIGCRFLCNRMYKEGKIPIPLRRIFSAMSIISTFVTYFLPRKADHLFCMKHFGI